MIVTFSNNPIDRLEIWLENNILTPISRYYYSHKKAHYRCCVCGRIIAPYFETGKYVSVIKDYGWVKGKRYCTYWLCHHCADHGFVSIAEANKNLDWRGFTWDEWQDVVQKENKEVLDLIKQKDPKYYNDWFADYEEFNER